jgi:hypothetical protein
MAEFIYDRDDVTVICLRVPRGLWDRWEYRHDHFGKAVHALRESCIDIMAARSAAPAYVDMPDPFHRDGQP